MHLARVAGVDLWFPEAVTSLQTEPLQLSAPDARSMPTDDSSPITHGFDGEGWLDEQVRRFTVELHESSQRVRFDNGWSFDVDLDGHHIDLRSMSSDLQRRDELMLGPALLLAFAARGIFGLHASTILGRDGAILLLGRSGSGKSTMARQAAAQGWVRLSDDVTPLRMNDGAPTVLPRFPQLKLSPTLICDDLQLPLQAMVWIEHGDTPMSLRSLAPASAQRLLLRDTVASRLFAPAQLHAQLDFCAQLAASAQSLTLRLPHVAVDDVPRVVSEALERFADEGMR